MIFRSFWIYLINPELFIEDNALANIWVFFGIQLHDVSAGGPFRVVNASVSDLNPIGVTGPSKDVGEYLPSFSDIVSLLKSTVHNKVFISTFSISLKANIINGHSVTIRRSSSGNIEKVVSNIRFYKCSVGVNVIVCREDLSNSHSVPWNRHSTRLKSLSLSGGVVDGKF